MERLQEIDGRIQELTEELERVEGTPTEIYTRIVGYYRSLKNWNKGKREEYDHRVTFRPDGTIAAAPATDSASARAGASEAAQAFADATVAAAALPARAERPKADSAQSTIRSYRYFYRATCPNCPPVRTYVENLSIDGEMVDVDTGDGLAKAIQHQILSTPTVLLMDETGTTVAHAGSVDQLRTILESAG